MKFGPLCRELHAQKTLGGARLEDFAVFTGISSGLGASRARPPTGTSGFVSPAASRRHRRPSNRKWKHTGTIHNVGAILI